MMKLIFHINYYLQVSKIHKALAKFSKTQLSEMIQSGGFNILI